MSQFKTEPKFSPVFEAVERALTDDQYLDVGQVMTENTVHELRSRFQHRDPAHTDRLATIEAVDQLVATGWVKWEDMFGSRCVRRLI